MIPTAVTEGFMSFKEYITYYKVVGDLARIPPGKTPILALHGRPVSHEALQPLEKLSQTGRPIIFYDQLGCGRSDRPENPSMWVVSHFVEEVANIRRHLNLERVHLFGHSWGGVVAMEYALTQPAGLISLILASTYCDRSLLDADFARLREELPTDIRDALINHEAAGTKEDPAYIKADKFFAQRHVCRVDPWPEYFAHSADHPPVGKVNTEGWTIRDQLRDINVPTLVTCGRNDFCTPAQAEIIHHGITGSEFVIFEDSSHYAHIEETDKYLSVLHRYLTQIETHAVNH